MAILGLGNYVKMKKKQNITVLDSRDAIHRVFAGGQKVRESIAWGNALCHQVKKNDVCRIASLPLTRTFSIIRSLSMVWIASLPLARTARIVLARPHPVNGKKRKMTLFAGGLRYVCKDGACRPCERSEAIQTIENERIINSVIVNVVKQSSKQRSRPEMYYLLISRQCLS
jgi:hypothetical protein